EEFSLALQHPVLKVHILRNGRSPRRLKRHFGPLPPLADQHSQPGRSRRYTLKPVLEPLLHGISLAGLRIDPVDHAAILQVGSSNHVGIENGLHKAPAPAGIDHAVDAAVVRQPVEVAVLPHRAENPTLWQWANVRLSAAVRRDPPDRRSAYQ